MKTVLVVLMFMLSFQKAISQSERVRYKTARPEFVEDFIYQPPWELMRESLLKRDAEIRQKLEMRRNAEMERIYNENYVAYILIDYRDKNPDIKIKKLDQTEDDSYYDLYEINDEGDIEIHRYDKNKESSQPIVYLQKTRMGYNVYYYKNGLLKFQPSESVQCCLCEDVFQED